MAYTIPTCEPQQGQAGESWFWDIVYADYPADESWELSYYLRGVEDADFLFGTRVSAGTGATFEVRVPASVTATLSAGAHRLIGRVTKAGEVHTVYSAHFLVLADPSTAVGAKSFNRTRLEALQAATGTTGGMREVSINGRRLVYAPEEYESQLAKYTYLVALESNPNAQIVHEAAFVRG